MIKLMMKHLDEILLIVAGSLCWAAFHPKIVMTHSETEKIVQEYFKNIPELVAVAYAESEYHQVDSNGKVYVCGPNKNGTYDKGIMQINSIHWERARKLDYNLDDIYGNMDFALLLYKEQGLKPWYSSKPRWEVSLRRLWASR